MPDVEPATFKGRAGVKESSVEFDVPWLKIPFDTYQGMTQGEFQASIAPHQGDGKLVPVSVPKGWRRVESCRPGKHFYVHMPTGSIYNFPKEMYSVKKGCWTEPDGTKIPDEEVMMDPYMRNVKLGANDPPIGTPMELPALPGVEASSAPALPPLPVCLMFPGQGSEYLKMCQGVKDIPAVREMFDKAAEILGYDLLDLCLNGPESKLDQTSYCQPAMFVAGLAAVEKLKIDKPDRFERVQACAGLSLGEYTALCVAGVFDFETGLQILKRRGELMQEQIEAAPQGTLSVAGISHSVLSKLCEDVKSGPDDVCGVANVLFPNGFSCAGSLNCIDKLAPLAKGTEGCLQVKKLKTSAAFHTPLMEGAREKFEKVLRSFDYEMRPPRCDVYMNATGKKISPATPPSEIIKLLSQQLVSPVQWEPCVKEMIRDGVTEFYECGPMKQLKAMMKRIDPSAFANCTTVDV